MTKRKRNGKRGGRGGGRGRGRSRGRGGGWGGDMGGGIQGSHLLDEALDFNIQMYADAHPANNETAPYGGGGGHARKSSNPTSQTSTPNRGQGRGRGWSRGRGRGHPEMYSQGRRSEYGIGASPEGRGRGWGTQKLRLDAPLTRLLHQERPLLRPIIFVPSVLDPILFDKDEALLKAGVEEVDDTEQSHVPTAARVSRVFSSSNNHVVGSSSEADNDDTNDDDDEELEVVDFNDVGKLFEPTKKAKKTSPKKSGVAVVEGQIIGNFIDNNFVPPSSSLQPQQSYTDMDILTKMIGKSLSATEKPPESPKYTRNGQVTVVESGPFYIDTEPSPGPAGTAPPSNLFPSDDFDDDIIVYVAPHPRKGVQISPEKQPLTNGVSDTSKFTPYVRDASLSLAVASSSSTATVIEQKPTQQESSPTQLPSMSSFSFSFATPEGKPRGRLRVPAVTTPRLAKSWKRKRGVWSKKIVKPKSSFHKFGAMREEAQLRDSKWNERRRGDSDLDWGDTDDDNSSGGEHDHIVDRPDDVTGPLGLANGDSNGKLNGRDKGKGKVRDTEDENGMDVDSDLDLKAMQQFVGGLLGEDAGRHTTIDDLMDEEQMRLEDEQDTGEGDTNIDESGSEVSSVNEDAEVERVLSDEEAMLISEALEFEEDLTSEDEDEDQTPRTSFRKRLERLRNQASSSKHNDDLHDFSDDYDDYDQMLDRYLAEKSDSYNKARLPLDPLDEADWDSEGFNRIKSSKRKQAGLPEDLKIQWEKDRLKKAAFKKARAQARLEAAADPLSYKKGGKKGRKAMLAAARADPTIIVIPNRIIDMVTLVQQIKRFINNIGGPSTMSLPPTNKATRKNVHEIAAAYNLKSVSTGKGDSRYTTLTKTSYTGIGVNEAKVAKIMRRSGGMGARGDSFVQDKRGKARNGAQALVPRHREGDEVGKAAPKLGSSNVGFRMLAMMGWSEGERIGATGGLQDPLTAIIKNTKLGLGAAK